MIKLEENFLKTLRSRLESGSPFTFADSLLISLSQESSPQDLFGLKTRRRYLTDASSLPPHIFSMTSGAYNKLKLSKSSQVVCLLGPSGSGKTFNMVHMLDHLISIASSDYLSQVFHSHQELLQLMHNGFQALHILGSVFSKENIDSSLCGLNCSIIFDQDFRPIGGEIKGALFNQVWTTKKLFQVLRAVMYANKDTLKRLGVNGSSKLFTEVSVDDWQVWNRFIDCLRGLGLTSQEIESLTDALGGIVHLLEISDSSDWKKYFCLQKACKLLGLVPEKLNELLAKASCKTGGIREVIRELYGRVFVWVNEKVNLRLAEYTLKVVRTAREKVRYEVLDKYFISIIDFPGFCKESSLRGLCINLAIESLNFYCCNDYLKLLSHLGTEKVDVELLQVPRAKIITEFFLAQESGLLNYLDAPSSLLKPLLQRYSEFLEEKNLREIIDISETAITVNFTWGRRSYLLKNLKSIKIDLPKDFANPVLKQSVNFTGTGEQLSCSVSRLLQSVSLISPHIIYCFRERDLNDTNVLRHSLVIPSVVWENSGLSHWIRPQDICREFSTSTSADLLEDAKRILDSYCCKYVVTANYIVLSDEDFAKLREEDNVPLSRSSFASLPTYFSKDQLMNSNTMNSFKFSIYSANNYSYEIPPQKLQEECSGIFTVDERPSSRCSSNTNIVTVKSVSSVKFLFAFGQLEYSSVMWEIVKIQSLARGFAARKYCKGLRKLAKHCLAIQKTWRGHCTRKKLSPLFRFHRLTKFVQGLCRDLFRRQQRNILIIQKWIRGGISRKEKPKSSMKNNLNRKIQKSFEERFELMEKKRKLNLHLKRQEVLQAEMKEVTLSPHTNSSVKVRGSFFDRQNVFLMSSKTKLSQKVLEKEMNERSLMQKSPCAKNRDLNEVVSRLHVWGKLRDSRIKKAQESKLIEDRSVSKIKPTQTTNKYANQRKLKIETEQNSDTVKRKMNNCYWPN